MKKSFVSLAWAVVCLVGLVFAVGCGGGGVSSGGGNNNPPPTITSFSSSAATIEAGSSSSLTAAFSNGAGVITPGNIAVTSGTPVSVSPSATTTYTLTVTGASGTTPATQTTTVTVNPVPTITSLTASPNPIAAGSSTNLTASFTGGTGVITPGNIAVTSGTAVSVSPAATTTYTLTVTPPVGSVTATQTVTVTVNASSLISSFSANPNFIASGKASVLIPVFTGGTGAITGTDGTNVAATSGGAFSVTPTQTTTYTLTVTPTGGGTPQTAQVTVTVYAITSFTASPNPIFAGGSTQLTAVFANGTGVITPGNIAITSGTPVPVSPATTTTYTLTVTPTQGSGSPITATTTVNVNTAVSVNLNNLGAPISDHLLGMNLAMWYDVIANKTPIVNAFQTAGITAVRWPGGSNSDIYHWNGAATYPATGAPTNCNGGYSAPDDTFANFLSDIVTPANLDLAITANYGSNIGCTGGGDPSEAAGWAAAAAAASTPIHYMTVGNEVYGSWEYDLHAKPHDPGTYAGAVTGSGGYYDLVKAQSANTLVGVVVDADGQSSGWDAIVLGSAKGSYDFVEYHYYPQYLNVTSDTYLVQQAALDFTTNIKTIKTELANANESGTPIYVGELGANSANPGTQSWSITQGLYAGQILGEAMTDGVARLTWWIGFGNCLGNAANSNPPDNNNSNASLYGWQNTWGAYNVFSDADPNCPGEGAIGTMSPTAQAFNLFQNVAVTGENALTASVNGDTTNVRAYAATGIQHGYTAAIVLFNLNENASETVSLALTGQSSSTDVKVITYDKAIYDQTDSATPVWAPPTTTDKGAQNLPLTLILTPWSMNVVLVK